MSRSIVQIAFCQAGAENGYSRHVLALADDGTLWEKDLSRSPHEEKPWQQIEALPPIPGTF